MGERDIQDDLSASSIIEGIEENFAAYLLFCSRGSNAQIDISAERVSILTGIPEASLNVVMRTQLRGSELKEQIHASLAPFREQRLPMLWWVFPRSRPHNLSVHLEAADLYLRDDEPGMAVDLYTLPAPVDRMRDLTITEVEDAESLQDWIQASAVSFGADIVDIDPNYIRFEHSLHWGKHLPYRRFLARLHGVPVATSALFLGAGVAGLYSVGTVSAARRQGIASALSLVALQAARAGGYRIGVLEASQDGYHVYHKLGFREYCRVYSYLGDFRML